MIIYKNQISNEELIQKLDNDQNLVILDVRETEEYALEHIPGSVLIPLGQLEKRCNELNEEDDIFIICRSGARSNDACHILQANGFPHVYNVVPGMKDWTGAVESHF